MKSLIALFLAFLLSACSTSPRPATNTFLFEDHLFAASSERISVDDIFALSPEMTEFIHTKVANAARDIGSTKALYSALYPKGDLRIDYDASVTRNARATFEAKSGNCLSLAIMTAALAKEFGLTVQFQQVVIDESWSRHGDLFFSSGHVNLVLGKRSQVYRSTGDPSDAIIIDFLGQEDASRLRSITIDEKTIVAMYMNNRAAESMTENHLDDAYWWAREAVLQDPSFTTAYNTLGVIYLRHGNPQSAQQVFQYALEREPRNTVAMFNMIRAMDDLGRTAEAKAWAARLRELEPEEPYHLFNLGRVAMQNGDFKTARTLFQKEVNHDPYNHEFQFSLALACFRLGDMQEANKHMKLAMEYSTTRSGRALYAAKLDRLRSYLTN